MKRTLLALCACLITGPAIAYSHGTPPVIPTLSPGGGYTSGSYSKCYQSQAYGVFIANSTTSPQPSALNGQIPNSGYFSDNAASGSAAGGCPTPSRTTVTGPTATGLLDVIAFEGIDDPNGIYVTLVDGVQDRAAIDHAEFWFEGNKITVGNQGAGRMISPTNPQSYGWVVRLTSGAGQNGLATVCGHSVPTASTEGDRWVCKTIFINTNASGAGYINRSLSTLNYYADPYFGSDTACDGTKPHATASGSHCPWKTALWHMGANAAAYAGITAGCTLSPTSLCNMPDNSGAVLNLASHGVATTTFSANTLTITGSLTGEFSVGDFVVGANVPPAMLLTSGGTCTSGAVVPPCTFITNIAFPVSGSGSVTAAGMYVEPNIAYTAGWNNANASHETIPFKVTTATQYGAVIQSNVYNGNGYDWNTPADLAQYDNIIFDKTTLAEFAAQPYNGTSSTAVGMWLSNGAVWEEYGVGCSATTMCNGYTDLGDPHYFNVETSNEYFDTNFTDYMKTYRGDFGYYASINVVSNDIAQSNLGVFGFKAAGSGTMYYNYFYWASAALTNPASYYQPVITGITFATDASFCPYATVPTGCLQITIDNSTGANANITSVAGQDPYFGNNTVYEVCFESGPQYNGGRQPAVRRFAIIPPVGAEQGCIPMYGFNGTGPWTTWITAPNMLTAAGFTPANCAPASGSFSGDGQTLPVGANCPAIGNAMLLGQTRHNDLMEFADMQSAYDFGPDNQVFYDFINFAGDQVFLLQTCGPCGASGGNTIATTTGSGVTSFTITEHSAVLTSITSNTSFGHCGTNCVLNFSGGAPVVGDGSVTDSDAVFPSPTSILGNATGTSFEVVQNGLTFMAGDVVTYHTQKPLPGDFVLIESGVAEHQTMPITSVSSATAGTLMAEIPAADTTVASATPSSSPITGFVSDRNAITTTLGAGTYNFKFEGGIAVVGDAIIAESICYASTATPPNCDNAPIPMTISGQAGCNPCSGYNQDQSLYYTDPVAMTIPANATIIISRSHSTAFTTDRGIASGFSGWGYGPTGPNGGDTTTLQTPNCGTGCTSQPYDYGIKGLFYTNPPADISGAAWSIVKGPSHVLIANSVFNSLYNSLALHTAGLMDTTIAQSTMLGTGAWGCQNAAPVGSAQHQCSVWLSSFDSIWLNIKFDTGTVSNNWNMDGNTFVTYGPVGTNAAQAANVTLGNTSPYNYATFNAVPTNVTQTIRGATNGQPLYGVDSVGNPLAVGASIVGAQQ